MSTEQNALNLVDAVAAVVQLIIYIGPVAIPIAAFVAGVFPQAAPLIPILEAAAPFLEKIVKYAPAVKSAIIAGKPVFDAIDKTPELASSIKSLLALASQKIERQIGPADVKQFAVRAFGQNWTDEESREWWDRAVGTPG